MTALSVLEPRPGELFLTEGGLETEVMFKHGFELPEFAMFTLLNNARAITIIRDIIRRQLDVAAEFGMSFLLTGVDYRASPDWGAKLGYSAAGLADTNIEAIALLRSIANEYQDQVPRVLIGGILGPRGDAYQRGGTITEQEAEDYHATQLATLKAAGADFACAATFNNIPEAVGTSRAAASVGIPTIMSLSVDGTSRLRSGPAVSDAIDTIDAETGEASPDFYMLNCAHPVEFEPALADGSWIKRMRGFRPNASKMEKIALCKLGHLEEGDPIELGELMGSLARRYPHMHVWGGCCGTGDVHLREIARNVCEVRSIQLQSFL